MIWRVLILLVMTATPVGAWIHGSSAPPTGYGGGPNLRAQNIYGAPVTVTPSQYYTPGVGTPAVSTSDWYYVNGSIEQRPVDLADSKCGAAGAAKAAAGQRYAWVMTPNHEGLGTTGDVDGVDIYLGYSDDPGVMPRSVEVIYRAQNANVPLLPGATFTGTIASNVLTVTSMSSGIVSMLSAVSGSGVTAGATISGTAGTGVGGVGTYNLSPGSADVSSPTSMTSQQVNSIVAYFSTMICNPDDATYPFYLYVQAGPVNNGYQEGLLKSSDLISWDYQETPFRNWSTGEIARNMQVARTALNTWVGWGPTLQASTGNQFGNGLWSSTDGKFFTFSGTYTNQCIPVYMPGGGFGPNYCPDGSSDFFFAGPLNDGISFSVGGQTFMAAAEATNTVGQSNIDGQYLTRVAVDSNFNVLASPAPVRISGKYTGIYPGPTYIISVGNYIEDGIGHYYVTHGNYECLQGGGCNSQLQSKYGAAVASASSGTAASGVGDTAVLHVGDVTGLFVGMSIANRTTNGGVAFGSTIQSIAGNDVTILGPPNTQTAPPPTNLPPIPTTSVVAGDVFLFYSSGLRQEFVDHYSEIVDSTAAAGAAPFGVTASAAAGVANITCYDVLPTNTYRLYRGTSYGTQATLIGDFTGCSSITDTPGGSPGVFYYKLVYLNAGVEKKSRVASTYVSSSVALVNAHFTRVLAAGANATTIDHTYLDTVASWLASNNRTKNLERWVSPSFGVIKDGSNVVSQAFDLGTTRLPRGRDMQPVNASTHTITYNATGMNGVAPALVGADSQAFATFGNGRINNIRRKTQITACAGYSKPGTGVATPLSFGSFGEMTIGMILQHTSGSPGNASFSLGDESTQQTVTSAMSSATGPHTICGTFDTAGAMVATDSGTLTVYADGVAGTPNTNLHSNIDMSLITTLAGQSVGFGISSLAPFMAYGSSVTKTGPPTVNAGNPVNPYVPIFENAEGNFSSSDLIQFDAALTQAEITSLTALLSARYH